MELLVPQIMHQMVAHLPQTKEESVVEQIVGVSVPLVVEQIVVLVLCCVV